MKRKNLFLVLLVLNSLSFADPIDNSINIIKNTNDKLENYQKQIDVQDEKKEKLFNEYKYVNENIKSTKKYNQQLQKIINSQNDEIKELDQQIYDIEQTQKNIYPLMEKMILSLKKLIQLDIPFLVEERENRVKNLEELISRADVKTAEKFRIILEAFKIEYDYAKNIETYQETTNNKTYNILRLGRVALYKQSLDLKEYLVWDNNLKTWNKVEESNVKSNIRKGIKIAKKQENVALLEFPFLVTKGK